MAINKIMVLGAGTMGMGIAQVFAEAGKTVLVRDIADAFIQRGEGVLKKNLEKNATISLATRVLDRIETAEGYVPGETPVAFAGRLDRNDYWNRGREAFADLDRTVGLWSDYAATYNLGRYLTDYLNAPLLWDTETDVAQWPEVQAMPSFPAAGSVALVDGTLVVKLS